MNPFRNQQEVYQYKVSAPSVSRVEIVKSEVLVFKGYLGT